MSVSLVEMRRQLVEEITRLTELVRSIDKARGVERGVPGTPSKDDSVGLLDTLPVGMVLGTDPESGKQLVAAKKRSQTPEARKRIGDFQRERHKKAREAKAAAEAQASGTPSGTLSQEIR